MKCPLVKYGDEGFACGHCGSTRTFSIENIGYHFRHCTEAKRKLEKLQEEQQLDALLSDDKVSTEHGPLRPVILVQF